MLQPVPHLSHFAVAATREPLACNLGGTTQTDDSRQILRSRASRAFVTASVEQWLKERPAADVQRTRSLRPVQFVAGDGQQLASNLLHVDGNLPCRLYCVRVKQNAAFLSDLSDLHNRLHDAGFIVGHHDRDQARVRADRRGDHRRIYKSFAIHRNVGDLATHLLQLLAGVQNGVMLDGTGDDVIVRAYQSENRQVIAFGPARGENDFRCPAAEQRCNTLSCLLHRRARLLPLLMDRGGVSEPLQEVRTHGLKHLGQ